MESIGTEELHHVLVIMFIDFQIFDLFFTVVSSATNTENELSNATLAEESNDDDKLYEKTDDGNITSVETEALEEVKSNPSTDIEEDKLSNETQEKHISEEIQDMESDSEYGNDITSARKTSPAHLHCR
jgi:hypothetical protein